MTDLVEGGFYRMALESGQQLTKHVCLLHALGSKNAYIHVFDNYGIWRWVESLPTDMLVPLIHERVQPRKKS